MYDVYKTCLYDNLFLQYKFLTSLIDLFFLSLICSESRFNKIQSYIKLSEI